MFCGYYHCDLIAWCKGNVCLGIHGCFEERAVTIKIDMNNAPQIETFGYLCRNLCRLNGLFAAGPRQTDR